MTKDNGREKRLDDLVEAMREGRRVMGTTLTLREIATFSGRVPPDDNVSSILMDLLLLMRQGKVRKLKAKTRCYEVVDDDESE